MSPEDLLSPDDIEALVHQLRDGDDTAAPVEDVATAPRRRYPAARDIRRPEREAIRKRIVSAAKSMEDALAHELAAAVRIELVELSPVSRRAFRDATEDLVVAPLDAPGAEALLAIEPALALAIVDRTLGGTALDLPDRKTLTGVERTLLEGVLRRSVEALFDASLFAPSARFRLRELAKERAAAPGPEAGGPAFGVQFLLTVGGALPPGEIRVFVPDPPIRESIGLAGAERALTPDEKRRLQAILLRLPLSLSIVIGRSRCGTEEIASLEPGDVIALDTLRDAPVVVRVGERPRFMARIGRKDGHVAVKINRWVGVKPPQPPPSPPPKAASPSPAPPTPSPTPISAKRPE